VRAVGRQDECHRFSIDACIRRYIRACISRCGAEISSSSAAETQNEVCATCAILHGVQKLVAKLRHGFPGWQQIVLQFCGSGACGQQVVMSAVYWSSRQSLFSAQQTVEAVQILGGGQQNRSGGKHVPTAQHVSPHSGSVAVQGLHIPFTHPSPVWQHWPLHSAWAFGQQVLDDLMQRVPSPQHFDPHCCAAEQHDPF
jgi:hypothetical protein